MAPQSKTTAEQAAIEEVRRLRAEVADLKEQLAEIHNRPDVAFVARDPHPWLRIAATVGVTFALGKLIRALRLPTATAVAIPMISNEVNRRLL